MILEKLKTLIEITVKRTLKICLTVFPLKVFLVEVFSFKVF